MKRGLFPGQEEAIRARLREIKEDGKRTANRRMFLGFAVGGVVCSGATVAIDPMRRWATPAIDAPSPSSDEPVIAASTPTLDRAVALATGPIDELVVNAALFLTLTARCDPDDRLWMGWTRLAASAADAAPPARSVIRRHLLVFSRNNPLPPHLQPWLELVRRTK